jgi:serine/alanine adding enzyme
VSIEIVQSLPEQEWRRFVDDHPEGNIFHTPEMFQVFSRVKGYKPDLWAAVDSNSRPLALLVPVQITLFNGLLRRVTTRAVAYGGMICARSDEGAQASSLLLKTYKHETKRRILFTELRNLSNLNGVQSTLREHGFVYEDHLNYLISLKGSSDEVFERFGRRTRKNIRRGLRQGKVTVEVVNERTQLSDCYRLLSQVYRHAQVPLADFSLFEVAFDLLHPKDMLRVTLARVDQVPAAVSFELVYKGIIYGWYGGSDRAFGAYVPNELVMWHILKWGAEKGYELYDFGGAGKPDEDYGVRDFKAKFGGELVCFGRNTYVSSPWLLTLSKAGYATLRRFL